jgi:hypothetical protein
MAKKSSLELLLSKLAQATPAAKLKPQEIELPEMVIDPNEVDPDENVIELPDMEINPNEIEVPEVTITASLIAARDSIPNLDGHNIRVAERRIQWVKFATGKTFEQCVSEHRAAGGDTLTAGKGQYGQSDVSKGQYEAILNAGKYLPAELPDNMRVEIRAAIQGGRAVGVTVATNPNNPKIISLIDAAVRGIAFPNNPKMDFVITKF